MADGFLTGTQAGDFNGIPPSGSEINVQFLEKDRSGDGKLGYHHILDNVQDFLGQLGLTDESDVVCTIGRLSLGKG